MFGRGDDAFRLELEALAARKQLFDCRELPIDIEREASRCNFQAFPSPLPFGIPFVAERSHTKPRKHKNRNQCSQDEQ